MPALAPSFLLFCVIPGMFHSAAEPVSDGYLNQAPPPPLRFAQDAKPWDNARLLSLKEFERFLDELRRQREAEALARAEAEKAENEEEGKTEKVAANVSEKPEKPESETLLKQDSTVISSLRGVNPKDRENFLRNLPGAQPEWFQGQEFLFHYRQDIDPDSDQQIEIPFIFEDALQAPRPGQIPSNATLVEE